MSNSKKCMKAVIFPCDTNQLIVTCNTNNYVMLKQNKTHTARKRAKLSL